MVLCVMAGLSLTRQRDYGRYKATVICRCLCSFHAVAKWGGTHLKPTFKSPGPCVSADLVFLFFLFRWSGPNLKRAKRLLPHHVRKASRSKTQRKIKGSSVEKINDAFLEKKYQYTASRLKNSFKKGVNNIRVRFV